MEIYPSSSTLGSSNRIKPKSYNAIFDEFSSVVKVKRKNNSVHVQGIKNPGTLLCTEIYTYSSAQIALAVLTKIKNLQGI